MRFIDTSKKCSTRKRFEMMVVLSGFKLLLLLLLMMTPVTFSLWKYIWHFLPDIKSWAIEVTIIVNKHFMKRLFEVWSKRSRDLASSNWLPWPIDVSNIWRLENGLSVFHAYVNLITEGLKKIETYNKYIFVLLCRVYFFKVFLHCLQLRKIFLRDFMLLYISLYIS